MRISCSLSIPKLLSLFLSSELHPNVNTSFSPQVTPVFQVQSQKDHRQVQLFTSSVMQWFFMDGIKIHIFLVT